MLHDLRYAVRTLLKHRNFTAAALLTLALGIGINTSVFTLLYSVAFRELPVKNPESVVNVYQTFSGEFSRQVEGNVALLSFPEYKNYRSRLTEFADLTASSDVKLYLGGNNVEQINGLMVTDNYFSLLGGTTALGRAFAANECQTALQCPVAVLSNGFWKRNFGSNAAVIGTSVILNQQRFTVIGVATADFRGSEMTTPDVWIPVTMQPAVAPDRKILDEPNCSWLSVLGRMRDGVSVDQLKAQMQLVATQMDQQYPGRRTTVDVMPGSYLNSPEVRSEGLPIALLVMGAVGLVLLIACANVSNLMLARAAARKKEIAVRLALGASRIRLIKLLLTECLVLAMLGGIAGLVLAVCLPPILLWAMPEAGLDIDLRPNLTVFGYMFLTSLITGVAFGLAPALESTKPNLTTALKSIKSRPRLSRPHLRNLLVVGQVAVSLVLLIGAGLLMRSFQHAQSAEFGFDHKDLMVLSMDLSAQGYDESRTTTLNTQLFERLKVLPGIKSVSVVETVPFSGRRDTAVDIDGSQTAVGANTVSPEYFHTLGIPFRRGRQFSQDDVRSGQEVTVITEAMANRFWPGVDPVGKRFKDTGGKSHEIIGVVADISSRQLGQLDGPMFYTPASQTGFNGSLVMRASKQTAGAIRDAAHSLDQNAFVSVAPLEESLSRMLEPARMGVWFSGTVSLLALLIAATGIYGMLSYHVVERTSEIGLRMALGAQRRNVLLLMIGDGMKLAVIGAVVGVVLAFALTRVMTTMLFGIAPTDLFTFAFVAAVGLSVALLACYIPARRATKVDPLIALRNE